MKGVLRRWLPCLVAALRIAAAAAEPADGAPVLTVRVERADALYRCGEEAVFEVAVLRGGEAVTQGTVSVALSLDGLRALTNRVLSLGPRPATVAGTLSEPGFLHCAARYAGEGPAVSGVAAAGFEPDRIQSGVETPEDFEAFWEAGRKARDAVPADPRLEPLPELSDARQESFRFSLATLGGERLHGFLSVPRGREPPFPALLTIPSAGIGKPRVPESGWAVQGALSLTLGVHALDPDLPAEQRQAAVEGLRNYTHAGAPDRERYYYRKAILGLDRALDYLATRPDHDARHLAVTGSSQGGGLSLVLAGLNGQVTAAAANVPALCDHAGHLQGRSPGWPGLVRRMSAAQQADTLAMARYYDAALFARRIRCPVLVGVGFIDGTCAPGSVYAAFNGIAAPKRILAGLQTGHGTPPDYAALLGPWLRGQLGLGPALPPPPPRFSAETPR